MSFASLGTASHIPGVLCCTVRLSFVRKRLPAPGRGGEGGREEQMMAVYKVASYPGWAT